MLSRLIAAAVVALACCAGCDNGAKGDESPAKTAANDGEKTKGAKHGGRSKFKLGRIDNKAITESSGLAASHQHPGVFWTHNDSGNGPYIFAITREGHCLAEFPVAAVHNTDWEAIAIDAENHLYISDTGNNEHKRDRALIYRVDEPDPAAAKGGKGMALRVNQTWRLKYPDKPFDAESLVVYKGYGYIISKLLSGKNAGLYRFALAAAGPEPITLEHVCDLPLRSPVTDACISDDAKQLAVLTMTGPYLFPIDGDMLKVAKVRPSHVTYFDPGNLNIEGVCFVEEGLLVSSEQGQMFLFDYKYFADSPAK